jgi:uncharacterized damage-inducible protein DinB
MALSDALLPEFDQEMANTRKDVAERRQKLFSLPRIVVLRSFVMNHMIHHRDQLTVYLRMNDAPVPAIYGPTADEGGMVASRISPRLTGPAFVL